MNNSKREALEAEGWSFGDAADLLNLTDEEKQSINDHAELELNLQRMHRTKSPSDLKDKE